MCPMLGSVASFSVVDINILVTSGNPLLSNGADCSPSRCGKEKHVAKPAGHATGLRTAAAQTLLFLEAAIVILLRQGQHQPTIALTHRPTPQYSTQVRPASSPDTSDRPQRR